MSEKPLVSVTSITMPLLAIFSIIAATIGIIWALAEAKLEIKMELGQLKAEIAVLSQKLDDHVEISHSSMTQR